MKNDQSGQEKEIYYFIEVVNMTKERHEKNKWWKGKKRKVKENSLFHRNDECCDPLSWSFVLIYFKRIRKIHYFIEQVKYTWIITTIYI